MHKGISKNKNLQALVDKFNEDWVERLTARHPQFRDTKDSTVKPYRSPMVLRLSDVSDRVSSGVGVQVALKNDMICIMSFTLERFPSCCGIYMMHTFQVNSAYIPADWLSSFMDEIFRSGSKAATGGRSADGYDMYMNNNRIHIMMVELGRGGAMEEEIDWRLQDIPPIDNPIMHYPQLYQYFKSKARCNERLFYNINSGNIIHDMEVVLS